MRERGSDVEKERESFNGIEKERRRVREREKYSEVVRLSICTFSFSNPLGRNMYLL